jgi:DNA-binding NtrC family response regulator
VKEVILLVEDDVRLRASLGRHLKKQGNTILEAGSIREAKALFLQRKNITLVLADILLPDGEGFELVDQLSSLRSPPQIIVMTGEERIQYPINAIKKGASDFLMKPFSMEVLDHSIAKVMESDITPNKSEEFNKPSNTENWRKQFAPEMIGSAPSLHKVFSLIERVADTDCSVFIFGESGTGKELVAKALHRSSERAAKPFITVNCAAIPENLLESELFGHIRGAFTGATSSREGRFQAAHGGTLFLDEIGELPLALQAKLLRAIQEKEVSPVGDSKINKVDVRIVSATNRNLEEMVEAGQFREDLLYRLNVIPIHLPALRERMTDMTELVQHFVTKSNQKRNRSIDGFSESSLHAMCTYGWPGNVRQLENMVERLVILKTEGTIELEDLPEKVQSCQQDKQRFGAPDLPEEGIDLRDAVEKFENALILQALERTGWNKNKAASILRMNRTTLVEKLKKKALAKKDDSMQSAAAA